MRICSFILSFALLCISLLFAPCSLAESADQHTASFTEYFTIAPGESISIHGVGRFTFNALHLDDSIRSTDSKSLSLNIWLEGDFENTSGNTLEYRNLFDDVYLQYSDENRHYSYSAWTFGEYSSGMYHSRSPKYHSCSSSPDSDDGYRYASILPQEKHTFMIGFDHVPDTIIENNASPVAVTLKLLGSDEKYIFYGKNSIGK